MRPDQMIDGRPGRRLTAFVEPEAGHHARIIRTPHARHEARLERRRHDAGRRPHDVGEPAAHIDRLTRFDPPSDHAHAAGMGIDQRRADRRAFQQTEIQRGRCRSSPRPGRCPARRRPCRFSRNRRQRDRRDRRARNSSGSSAARARGNSTCRSACRSSGWPTRWRGTKDSRRDRGNARPNSRSTANGASATAAWEFPFPAKSSRRHSEARRHGYR